MTDKDSVKAMKCFDIDWCGSYEVTSNGSAKQRLCTLKTSYSIEKNICENIYLIKTSEKTNNQT